MKDNLYFIREAVHELENVGALFPTSRWAADELIKPLRGSRKPLKILELGSGSGAVTVRMLPQLRRGDEVTVCEINPRMMTILKKRLRGNKRYKEFKDSFRFFTCPAQDLPEDRKYDVIICALPFLNFDLETVKSIFAKIRILSSPPTTMTYYEYIGLRHLRKAFANEEKRSCMKDVDRFFEQFIKPYQTDKHPVWLNVLPINIYQIQMNAQPA